MLILCSNGLSSDALISEMQKHIAKDAKAVLLLLRTMNTKKIITTEFGF